MDVVFSFIGGKHLIQSKFGDVIISQVHSRAEVLKLERLWPKDFKLRRPQDTVYKESDQVQCKWE